MYASASLGAQRDHALAQRPGGDRDGWYANLLYRRRLGERASAELGYVHQDWTGKEAYSPGLIDKVRAQSTHIGRASVTYALGKNQSLQLEGRIVRNHENISIFQYTDRQLQLSWQWQGF
jgi:enoyl-CoA hydratase/carnithine racemase